MQHDLIEMGFSNGRINLLLSKQFDQFALMQMCGILCTSEGIRIRVGGRSHRLSDNDACRYPSWRLAITRPQFKPPVEFSQVPVHHKWLSPTELFAFWPEPDMIKPPRKRLAPKRSKVTMDSAREFIMELVRNDPDAFDDAIACANEIIECLEVLTANVE